MKKLMIAAAIVCAAVCTQASVFKWTFNETTQTGADLTGGSVYILTSTDYATFAALAASEQTFDALKEYSLDDGTISSMGSSTKKYAASSDASALPTATWAEGLAKAQDLMFVIVSADEKSFAAVAGDVAAEAYTPGLGAEGQGGGLSISKGGDKTITAANFKSFAGGDVPEPTSAMLILLGMAGLALRRRA